jgi:DNA-binding XRE family transcriptional regulator
LIKEIKKTRGTNTMNEITNAAISKAALAIRKLRLTLSLQQNEMAKKIGVSPSAICAWEQDRRLPRLPHVRAMLELAKYNKITLTLEDFVDDSA